MQTLLETIGDSPIMQRFAENIKRCRDMSPEERAALDAEEEAKRLKSGYESLRRTARAQCGLEDEMWERTFDSFPVEHPTQGEALKMARRFVDKWTGQRGKRRRGLMLWGEPGLGKSGIMQALVQAILEKPKIPRVLYLPCAEMRSVCARIDVLYTVGISDLVIFDDIEKGMDAPKTRYKSEEHKTIVSAINRIDRRKCPVICVTSNYSLADHRKRWPAFADRLSGLVLEMHVDGPSKRPVIDEEREVIWWNQ